MSVTESKHVILILGASGFLGNALYKELCSYFKTYGTYATPNKQFENNKQFVHFQMEEDSIVELLEITKPSVIISALRGEFALQEYLHRQLAQYINAFDCKLIFLSSANVFDAYSKFPSYPEDKTFSQSVYGHFKIKIENLLLRLPQKQILILRLPMVYGAQSPRIKELLQQIEDQLAIEVFPNIIINVTTVSKLTQQIHYMINQNRYGIYHLGSTDLVHHEEFTQNCVKLLSTKTVHYKMVYTSNDDRYLAVLPRHDRLPKHLHLTSSEVLKELEL